MQRPWSVSYQVMNSSNDKATCHFHTPVGPNTNLHHTEHQLPHWIAAGFPSLGKFWYDLRHAIKIPSSREYKATGQLSEAQDHH